jgi:hypothetical protein
VDGWPSKRCSDDGVANFGAGMELGVTGFISALRRTHAMARCRHRMFADE